MKKKKVIEKRHIDERVIEQMGKDLGIKIHEVSVGNSYIHLTLPEKLKLKDGKELEIVISSIEQENKKILHSLLNKLENI